MKEMINIAELLKDCPKGMELYSPIFGNVYLEKIRPYLAVVVSTSDKQKKEFLYDGRFGINGECMLFPSKENRDWSTFQRPFKDGDILATNLGSIFILKEPSNKVFSYGCYIALNDVSRIVINRTSFCIKDGCRFATEEEKQKLFDAIKANDYKWNPETKTLEKLCPFNAGAVLVSSSGNIVLFSHIDARQVIYYHCILDDPMSSLHIIEGTACGVGTVNNCKLATKEQRDRLFDRLQKSGYKYNSQTNKLEKLVKPQFNVGDRITNGKVSITIGYIDDEYYYEVGRNIANRLFIKNQDDWRLDKFDITVLKSFDKVLVRCSSLERWHIQLFEKYNRELGAKYPFICLCNNKYSQCIPYKGNEYLLDTIDDCDNYYKTWE